MKTLGEFIIQNQNDFPHATGELTALLSAIKLGAKIIHNDICKAGLIDIVGYSGTDNIQGEKQTKLDLIANAKMIDALKARKIVAGIASEEEDDLIIFETSNDANYVVLMDPIDGSSNVDVNIPVGTIFSIYHRLSASGTPVNIDDFLQPGSAQVAAGYIVYGASTMLVYTTGNGVHSFIFDPSVGVFFLAQEKLRYPEKGNIYSINEGHYRLFPDGVKQYIKYCQDVDLAGGRPYTSRYVGSLVADFHRNLIKGGIFLYPCSTDYPEGKLRLLYECNPLAFLAEQAGGVATDGAQRILDLLPTSIHQRTPLYVGNALMVKDLLGKLGSNVSFNVQ